MEYFYSLFTVQYAEDCSKWKVQQKKFGGKKKAPLIERT